MYDSDESDIDYSNEMVEINHDGILWDSDQAVLVLLDCENNKQVWLPLNQCQILGVNTIAVRRWLAEKEGLI